MAALSWMHDSSVDRTTNGRGLVSDLTFDQIRRLDAGAGERVPTLREALEWSKRTGVRIDIDHKSGDVGAIAQAVREAGAIGNVVIEGPYDRLLRFAELLPGVDTMPKVESAGEIARTCASLRTTVVRLSIAQLRDPAAVRAVHDCGARVAVTVLGAMDSAEGITEAISLGAQMIETGRPDLAARLRESIPGRK